jgi:hypothetical protein
MLYTVIFTIIALLAYMLTKGNSEEVLTKTIDIPEAMLADRYGSEAYAYMHIEHIKGRWFVVCDETGLSLGEDMQWTDKDKTQGFSSKDEAVNKRIRKYLRNNI